MLDCVKETADTDLESSPRLYVSGDPLVVGQSLLRECKKNQLQTQIFTV